MGPIGQSNQNPFLNMDALAVKKEECASILDEFVSTPNPIDRYPWPETIINIKEDYIKKTTP